MLNFDLTLDIFIALFALLSPLFAVPVFLGVTANFSPKQQQRTALVASLTTAIALCVTALVGDQILYLFGINIPSFQIAGGLIVFSVAWSLLNNNDDSNSETPDDAQEQNKEESSRKNIAVYPLAIPLFAGPGVFATIIVFSSHIHSVNDFISTLAGILGMSLLLWLSLVFAVPLSRILSKTAINIGTRILGILLAAIAVEMVLAGIDTHFQ